MSACTRTSPSKPGRKHTTSFQPAKQKGANAVIAMRYDANEIMDGITEVLAYGTGVWVEPPPE